MTNSRFSISDWFGLKQKVPWYNHADKSLYINAWKCLKLDNFRIGHQAVDFDTSLCGKKTLHKGVLKNDGLPMTWWQKNNCLNKKSIFGESTNCNVPVDLFFVENMVGITESFHSSKFPVYACSHRSTVCFSQSILVLRLLRKVSGI